MKSDERFSDMLDKTILVQYQYEYVSTDPQLNEFKKGCKTAAFFFTTNKHAVDFKIKPSFRTLRLLSSKVLPVEVISVIISEDPING